MFYFGGVQKVYAVDVGRFQLADEVKSDRGSLISRTPTLDH